MLTNRELAEMSKEELIDYICNRECDISPVMKPEVAIVIKNGQVKNIYADSCPGVYLNIINLDAKDANSFEEAMRALHQVESRGAALMFGQELKVEEPSAPSTKSGADAVPAFSAKTTMVVDEIIVDGKNNVINVCLCPSFDAEKKFPEYAEAVARGEDVWMDLYADYDPAADTIHVYYFLNTDHGQRKLDYEQTAEEEANLKQMIADAIYAEYEQTPEEFLAESIGSDDVPVISGIDDFWAEGKSIVINACLNPDFDAEGKLPEYDEALAKGEDDWWMDLFANYDPAADTIRMNFFLKNGRIEKEISYEPTAEEEASLKKMIADAIYAKYEQTPEEFLAESIGSQCSD